MFTFVLRSPPWNFSLEWDFLKGLPLTDCEAYGSHLRIVGFFVLGYPLPKYNLDTEKYTYHSVQLDQFSRPQCTCNPHLHQEIEPYRHRRDPLAPPCSHSPPLQR